MLDLEGKEEDGSSGFVWVVFFSSFLSFTCGLASWDLVIDI